MTYQFERDPESWMIFVDVLLDELHKFKMVLDTGASRTTFDKSVLFMADYTVGGSLEKGAIETANGIVEVDVFKVGILTALGRAIHDMPIQVYDFLAHGILSDYDGVLGIDFFENTIFTIDMEEQTIEVKSKKNQHV